MILRGPTYYLFLGVVTNRTTAIDVFCSPVLKQFLRAKACALFFFTCHGICIVGEYPSLVFSFFVAIPSMTGISRVCGLQAQNLGR
ncbi:hypothetical protein P153DRAFT_12433 [Dothidotthia symphoricarpi CBS 119687]|uniref:Uncharacterized protein n=1 Tax=Dothidotthia symphoricarpi CBS 119687 TaxID=1392245 RepID=A0A6A6ATB6_9PLEO|nr:uncharacterized protein P153DRAFT_12433 [Dothidotthia symphoricarpi CBS 119687]KAF2134910.1 hypothetical protein P153DRAFT_12433 [Dothidotthia symphoricarpi CBS 119687]